MNALSYTLLYHIRGCFVTAFYVAAFAIFASCTTAYAQQCPYPSGCVTISREAAIQAVENADKVKALEAEGKAKDQAIADQKEVISKLKVEYAEKVGENIALKQNAVSDRAIIDILIKGQRKKCMPLSICF